MKSKHMLTLTQVRYINSYRPLLLAMFQHRYLLPVTGDQRFVRCTQVITCGFCTQPQVNMAWHTWTTSKPCKSESHQVDKLINTTSLRLHCPQMQVFRVDHWFPLSPPPHPKTTYMLIPQDEWTPLDFGRVLQQWGPQLWILLVTAKRRLFFFFFW